MNPGNMMKLMAAKKQFTARHPKFVAFVNDIFSKEIEAGTVMELTITRPGQSPVTTNIKVQPEDAELIREMKAATARM